MSRQVIVAGFHRSGTSLTAQLLERAGLFMGDELLGADFTNVHGHVEDRKIVRLHDEILADNELTWQLDSQVTLEVQEARLEQIQQIIGQRESEHGLWGFKDPRVCLFLDTWKRLLPDAKILVVYRSPVETTSSLHRRAATGSLRKRGNQKFHRKFWEVPDLALKMWLTYNDLILDFARKHPEDVLIAPFDMLRRGLPLIELLNQRWGLELEEMDTSEVFDPGATAKSIGQLPVANANYIGAALETWTALEDLSRKTGELPKSTLPSNESLTEEDFLSVGDLYDTLMEGEFHKIRAEFLQDRTQELGENQSRLQTELEQVKTELEQYRKRAVPAQRMEELVGAEKDLKLIVDRMSRSKVAPIFRLKDEFRRLEHRYTE